MAQPNFTRLRRCMRRAQQGGELTLGFFGGSITQDCAATVHENCYAYRVFQWWERTFPPAKFHYVNGGIGGTSSHFGAARVVSDLLMYQPDFVVVDFSVNDMENPLRQETCEGVLRRILSWPSVPAVVLLNNVCYDTGYTDQDCHNQLGDRYGLPHVSVRDTVYQRMLAGEFTRDRLTADGLHPNDFCHGLIAGEITALLERVRTERNVSEEEPPLPPPITANSYEHARRLTIREASPVLAGFREDAALMKELGLNAYRFSLSWPRLLPEGVGRVNEAGVRFYDQLIDALLENGITPYVTLFHWDYPYALYQRGGWMNPDSPEWFGAYAKLAAERFSDRVARFFTLHEPQCFVGLGFLNGVHAPFLRAPLRDTFTMAHNVLRAHGQAVRMLRTYGKRPLEIGYAPTCSAACPERETADDIEAARRGYFQWSLLDNFEWERGYSERFGLVYVDYRTQRRIPKDSASRYQEIIRTNGGALE